MIQTQRADAKPINTRQPVVVVDLDGCLVANPPESLKSTSGPAPTIPDVNFWANHWNDPMGSQPHYELIQMVRTLQIAGWKVIVLTARPDSFRAQTEQFLRRVELNCSLIMRSGGNILPSTEWKANTVQYLIELGYDVRLAIEDYKPNADAIRGIVPVLLYERKR